MSSWQMRRFPWFTSCQYIDSCHTALMSRTARLNVANSDRRRDNVLLEICARFVRVMDGQYLPFMLARGVSPSFGVRSDR